MSGPPARLERLLARALPWWMRDATLGDLAEEFHGRAARHGRHAASRWYAREALALALRYAPERWRGGPDPAGLRILDSHGSAGDRLMTDLRHVLRGLRRSPGFVAAAVLTLAVGIAANVTVFALIDAVLFRPLSTFEPDRLIRLGISARGGEQSTRFAFSYADYRDIRSGTHALQSVAASALTPFVIRAGQNDAAEALGEIVSGEYFPMLHLETSRGRLLAPADDRPGAPPVAVISRRAAERHFATGEPLAATIHLNGRPYTVIGIAPVDFSGTFIGAPIDVWIPAESAEPFFSRDWRTSRAQTAFSLLARLAHDVTRQQAQAELDALSVRIGELDSAREGTRLWALEGDRLRGRQRDSAVMFATVLAGLVGLLLLIVCANVANLLLARGIGLRRQMAIRMALGASRGRLMSLVLAESFVLAVLGGAGALALAIVLMTFVSTFNPLPTLSLDFGLRLDMTTASAAAAIALITGVLLGIVPAWQASRPDVQANLREESGTIASGRTVARLRSALVVSQVAVSLLLLSASGLFARSLINARDLDLGFTPDGAMAIDVDLAAKNLAPADAHRLFDELARRLRARADVTYVAVSNRAPVDSSTPVVEVIVGDRPAAPGRRAPEATMYAASADYFQTVGVGVLHGRTFREGDTLSAPRVAIVNETMARRYWGGAGALGSRFRTSPGGSPIEVVGIARDSRYRSLGEPPHPHVYIPFAQTEAQSATVIVRAAGDPRPLLPVVSRELERLPVPLEGFFGRTLRDHLKIYLLPSELAAGMSASLGAVAMLVAAVGLYGLIAYIVAQRTPEIAVRMALGASSDHIRALVLASGLRLLVPGLLLGTIGAAGAGRLAAGLLYGVGAVDPATIGGAALVLAMVVMTASYLPARRAMRVDPAVALRR